MKLLFLVIILIVLIYLITIRKETMNSIGLSKNLKNMINDSIYTQDNNAQPMDPNDKIYNLQYWTVKDTGYSDIFNYEDIIEEVPKVSVSSSDSIFPNELNGFTKVALALNPYYNQDFVLYEKLYRTKTKIVTINENPDFLNGQIYEYLLVKSVDGKPMVIHQTPPREKVVPGNVIYFAYGNFQLGPLTIKNL